MAVEVSPRAVNRIKEILHDQKIPEGGLRLGVKGGGCSGMSYLIDLETQIRTGDKVFEYDGIKLFVDLKSFLYLNGMTLDYKDEGGLMGRGFNIINPNAMGHCGCGESFAV